MVELAIPVLVTVGQRDVYEVTLPRLTDKWRGPSLATLLDDVALALMERLPREAPERMPLYLASPHVELRKVPVTLTTKRGKGEDPEVWKGRLSVVFWRWPDDKLYLATIPRLSPELFAVSTPGALEAGTHAFVAAWAEKHGSVAHAASAAHEHLELLSVEVSFPSPLPSQPRRRPSPRSSVRKKATPAPRPPVDRSVPPVTLRSVARNLSAAAQDGRLGHAYAREALLELLLPELCADSAAILLVGPTGVGKTAIVHELVHRLIARQTGVKDRTDVWQVDGNRIIAGMSVVGAWEQRLTEMVTELSARGDVLYVEDLPVLAFTGRSAHGNANVAELLAPHLERGELRVIGECTEERLAAVRDEAPGFFEHFRVVYVPELDEATTLEVLEPLVRQLVRSDEAVVSLDTLTAVLGLTRRFQGARALPGRAVSVLASLLDERVTEGVDRDALGRRKVGVPELVAHYSRRTGLPRFVLWEREARDQQALVEHFTRRIVAQPAAVEAAVDVVTLLEQGLNDPGRPLATFLFVGPTGVGKTETAKALAELLFGSGDRLVRFDMSEFQDRGSVARLIGDRHTPSGELTRRVEGQPFSVVLLDEIEKAHPAVFDALLGVLGEGRLTNALGRTVDFTSTIIIMTSNLGVREAGRRVGFAGDRGAEAEAAHVDAARRFFRPELYNRIDRVVSFRALDRAAVAPLVQRQLAALLGRRGLERSSVLVEVEPELVETLIDRGFDPRYGARSLRRELEQRLALPLAEHLVQHHGAPLTLATLGSDGDEVKLSLAWPEPVVRAALPLPSIADWATLDARLVSLREALAQLAQDDDVVALERERSILLRRHNQGELTPDGEAALDAWSEMLAERVTLARELGELEESLRTDEPFVERVVELQRPRLDWSRHRAVQIPEVRLAPVARGSLRAETVAAAIALELRFASLVQRVRAARGPRVRNALLRLWPFDRSSRRFAWELREAWVEAWSRMGTATPFVLPEGSDVWVTEHGVEGRAYAVELSGPGALAWAREEVGWVLDVSEQGASKASDLVAVEEVGDDTEAAARLAALPNTRPELPLRRHLVSSRLTDDETGVVLRRGHTLGRELREVGLLRIFARYREVSR
jgi:ATP-dependent Clp protease ATP-binding subunit ClpC